MALWRKFFGIGSCEASELFRTGSISCICSPWGCWTHSSSVGMAREPLLALASYIDGAGAHHNIGDAALSVLRAADPAFRPSIPLLRRDGLKERGWSADSLVDSLVRLRSTFSRLPADKAVRAPSSTNCDQGTIHWLFGLARAKYNVRWAGNRLEWRSKFYVTTS